MSLAPHEIRRWLSERRAVMLGDVLILVRHESPSRDRDALDGLAILLAERYRSAGAVVELLANPAGGDHVKATWSHNSERAPALVLGHFDTVWPVGTIKTMPICVELGRAFGPGIYDMKASLVLVDYAMRVLRALNATLPRPVVALLTSDEEIGSPASRRLIEDEAKRAAYVLVLEAPLADGRLKTARKGVGNYTLEVTGLSAHAGVEPEKGVNALVELAHQILHIQSLNDPLHGLSVTATVASGGMAANVVPGLARATIDVRVANADQAALVDSRLRAIRPVLAGASVAIHGGLNRPPMQRTSGGAALFEQARAIGGSLGLELGEGSTGGGSDANFTAALGVPTLDGLGCRGDGAHAIYEHIWIESLTERAALLAALLLGLRDPGGNPGEAV